MKHPSDFAICISSYLTKHLAGTRNLSSNTIKGHLLPAFIIYEGDEQKDRQDLLG